MNTPISALSAHWLLSSLWATLSSLFLQKKEAHLEKPLQGEEKNNESGE